MSERVRKPEWLKISIGANERYTETKRIVESHCLHTICSSGRCPNMGECWGKGTATFMIGGDICTRCCKFCNTQTGKPMPLDPQEPVHVAESIALMKLFRRQRRPAGFGSRPLGANNPRNQTPQPGYDR
jgi:lipoic acid synthetase